MVALDKKCKICRRAGVKLFLKGERCFSPKCAMVKRAYPPGQRKKRRRSPLSEYGKELREKQRLKNMYGLREKQFKNYVKDILEKRSKVENAPDLLIKNLELRLDNVVFRLGFTASRNQARQLVSHGYFLVNGRSVNFPSYNLKKGDVVSMKPQKTKKVFSKNLTNLIKKYKAPGWLQLDSKKLEGKVVGAPTFDEVAPPVEMSAVFEFYSR